jgi:membrane protease YdiL (CAAX protease family)
VGGVVTDGRFEDPRAAYRAAVAVLAAMNVVNNELAPGWSYVPLNAAAGWGLVSIARRGGTTGADLGLDPDRLRTGAGIGGALGLGIGAAVAAAAAFPRAERWFADERSAGTGVAGLAYQTAFRIPLGTALFEEVAFRGVLPALGARIWGRRRADVVAAGLFGLWHVLPTRHGARANTGMRRAGIGRAIAAGVAITTAGGLAFSALRNRTGSLAAPVLVHAAANAASFAAAWAVMRRGAS